MRRVVFSFFAVAASLAGWGYGVDVTQALKREVESTCVPVNSKMFRMRQPDGQVRQLIRLPTENSLLSGDGPWVGAIRVSEDGQLVNVLTSPEFKGEKTEFCFLNGHLRFMSVGKKDYEFNPRDYATPTNAIASLWPNDADAGEQRFDDADLWRNSSRLRLFSRNPNRTALVIAESAMVLLGVGLFAGTWWARVPGLLVGLLMIYPLLRTESRGGLLAFLAGLAILLFIRFRKGISRRFAVGLLLALVATGAVVPQLTVSRQFSARLATACEETFEGKRAYMWREVPRMLAAAPFGWGLWKSGPAYNSWFERPDRMHMTGDLFNDHLSRLVEGGFALGGLYVFAWAFVLLFSLVFAWKGGSPIPLAVWSVYFIASIFNPMNFWGKSFCVPLAVSCLLFFRRGRPSVRRIAIGAGASSLAVMAGVAVAVVLAPEQDIPLRVSCQGGRVIAGNGEPRVWVVEDGFALDGNYFGFPGREIRDFYRAHPDAEAMGLVNDLSCLPSDMRTLVLAGKACEAYLELPEDRRPSAECVVFLSPSLKYDKILGEVGSQENVHVVLGEFAARLEGGCADAPESVHVVPGAELYVPGWLESVIVKKGKE